MQLSRAVNGQGGTVGEGKTSYLEDMLSWRSHSLGLRKRAVIHIFLVASVSASPRCPASGFYEEAGTVGRREGGLVDSG